MADLGESGVTENQRRKEYPATDSGAQREKLNAVPYDLFPFAEIVPAYCEVAEFGAAKYTKYWSSEWAGLLNANGVIKIEISLPEVCVRNAIMKISEEAKDRQYKRMLKLTALFVDVLGGSKSNRPKNAVVVTIDGLKQPTLNITAGRKRTLGNTTGKTRSIGFPRKEIDIIIQFLERVTNEQSSLLSSGQWGSQKNNTKNIEKEGAPSASHPSSFILTTTITMENLGEFSVQGVTMDSVFWETISQELKKLSPTYMTGLVIKEPGQWNWSKGLGQVQIMGSLLRHIWAYLRGEDLDQESGLAHTSHILWNACALSHHRHHRLCDDRRGEPIRNFN